MILPDIWGPGAILSYAGLSGRKLCKGFIDARLCADSFAFRINSKSKCTLRIIPKEVTDIRFVTVMSDYIKATVKNDHGESELTIIFIDMNTIVIHSESEADINIDFENEVTIKKTKKCILYTFEGETFAIARKKTDKEMLAVLTTGDNASQKAEEILKKNIADFESEKLSLYASLPELKIPNENIEKLYYKCVSVLSSALFSSEGLIKSDYIAVENDNLKALRPFYSSICTLGLRHILPQKAKDTLESILASIAADGMISSEITTTSKSSILCPPTLAWCFWELYTVNGDRAMLENAYNNLKNYLHYIIETRDINKNHLYEWQIGETEGNLGKESSMDNSPRFDDGVILDCVDFSAFTANEAKYMSKIANRIDKHGEALYWDVVFERIKNAVNEVLFDEDDKIYYDKAVVSNMFKKIKTSASFLPLFANICENRHAMALLKFLNNEDKFNLRYGIPSVSKDSEDYCDDMFRGPMHIITNYLIAKGLESYEMHDKANEIKAKSLEAVMQEFQSDGVLYEFYSADGTKRAGILRKKAFSTNFFMNQSIKNQRDFAPTAAIIIDMLLSKSKKLPVK